MPSPLNRRKFERLQCRLPCVFRVEGVEHRGFVVDISANGLFLQTPVQTEPGTEITLTLETEDGAPFDVNGSVARAKKSHRGATSVLRGGFGVAVESAAEAFFQLVGELQARRANEPGA